jgi:hypothetical protein
MLFATDLLGDMLKAVQIVFYTVAGICRDKIGYGCTVLGWAGGEGARHIEEAHGKGVRLFATSVGFLTESSRVIDYSPNFLDAACRNFEGQPFVVPWLWDQKHKGQPAWWWCTNSPLYREYLKARLSEVMKARPDGLHVDDYPRACRSKGRTRCWSSSARAPTTPARRWSFTCSIAGTTKRRTPRRR